MKSIITLAFTLASLTASAAEISLTAADGFQLKADYFAGGSDQPAVILLHQCNGDRSMSQQVGERLSQHGIHVLALDFRGYGESVTADVDVEAIRASTEDRGEYNKAMGPIRQHWPSDVELAVDFLRERTGSGPLLGAGGASCGGGQAIRLAEQRKISALMMFSSGLSEEVTQRYLALGPIPTLFIAAEEDRRTYETSQAAFAKAQHDKNRMIAYKGKGHGEPLFEHDPNLVDVMVGWYREQLKPAD